jgi:N6-adenosine-specific RNA methylase IME4
VRGDATRFRDKNLRSWAEYERGAHSEKPEEVRRSIERASPGPYLELFGRRPVEGWAVWGDQVAASLLPPGIRELAA